MNSDASPLAAVLEGFLIAVLSGKGGQQCGVNIENFQATGIEVIYEIRRHQTHETREADIIRLEGIYYPDQLAFGKHQPGEPRSDVRQGQDFLHIFCLRSRSAGSTGKSSFSRSVAASLGMDL